MNFIFQNNCVLNIHKCAWKPNLVTYVLSENFGQEKFWYQTIILVCNQSFLKSVLLGSYLILIFYSTHRADHEDYPYATSPLSTVSNKKMHM